MKLFLLFILILLNSVNSNVNACGYYPFREDIRFNLLKPDNFRYKDYLPFYYTTEYYSHLPEEREPPDELETSLKLNVDLWKKRCKGIPSEKDVYQAIYCLKNELSNRKSSNKFVKCLYQNKDSVAINYLVFAQQCESLNNYFSDPWERQSELKLPQRDKRIQYAVQMCKTLKDGEIKRRYAFLAIRLSYYNNDFVTIKNIYKTYFNKLKKRNIVDYWSMYFMALCEKDATLCNYYSAQVFANAPDKRFQIAQQYHRKTPIAQTLRYAKSVKERAAIYLLDGAVKPARAIESIKHLYRYNPQSEGLSLLLLREINKLEDWIYTPYYSYFEPSIFDYDKKKAGYASNQLRIADDRNYAHSLLNFCNTVNSKSVENPLLWKISKAYLNLMIQDYDASLQQLQAIKAKVKPDRSLSEQLSLISALCIIARQEINQAVIPSEIKPVLMREISKSNFKFVFAIARELEFKGNRTEAALLFSKLNTGANCEYESCESCAFWKTKKQHNTLYDDYYTNYFYYIDAQYSQKQVVALIQNIENQTKTDSFSIWKYSSIRNDVSRLYDLLGTKYLRINQLNKALTAFQKVNDTLWTSQYLPYSYYLAANPFYTNMYNEHKPTNADSIKFNKESIIKTMIQYRKLAENPACKDRDFYYFLLANCYFNMSHYGNSWMMRRYFSSNRMLISKLIDDKEYYNCNYAKFYYLKAKSTSKSKKFAALCLRMAGRCEYYRLQLLYVDSYGNRDFDVLQEKVTRSNRYYKLMKQKYPNYYTDLMSNCESFDTYFNARN